MPFQSSRRHEIWSLDVRYTSHRLPQGELPEGGTVFYAISVLENHSRALLAGVHPFHWATTEANSSNERP